MRNKIAIAVELNADHLAAHKRLKEANEEAARAQAKCRERARETAEAEGRAIAAANEVRRLHLDLGAVAIGMSRATASSIDLRKN